MFIASLGLGSRASFETEAVTSPYNADFDGDEMNLHLAQAIPCPLGPHSLAS